MLPLPKEEGLRRKNECSVRAKGGTTGVSFGIISAVLAVLPWLQQSEEQAVARPDLQRTCVNYLTEYDNHVFLDVIRVIPSNLYVLTGHGAYRHGHGG